MAKLHKIKSLKSIKDVIERNHKSKDLIELYQNNAVLVTVRFLLIFFLEKTTHELLFRGINASFLYQI